MKARLDSYKVLNPEEFKAFSQLENWDTGKLVIHIAYNPKTQKGELPIIFALKYKAYNKDFHTASFMTDYRYFLEFNYNEDPYNSLLNFLVRLVFSFVEHIHINTGRQIMAPKEELIVMDLGSKMDTFIKEVIFEAQSQLLLQKPD